MIELVITDMAWDKLTEAQQECIKIAAKECQEYNKELSEKIEEDTLAELGDQITVVEVDKAEIEQYLQASEKRGGEMPSVMNIGVDDINYIH